MTASTTHESSDTSPDTQCCATASCCGDSPSTVLGAHGSDHGADGRPEWGYTHSKKEHLTRLRRIEGQTRGLQRMVEDDAYCIDILTQISAVTSALESLSLKLLEEHLNHCVAHAIETGGEEARQKLDEANRAIARLVRS